MLPIVFIHYGWSWYVAYALYQARVANPDAEIILITDVPHLYNEPGVRVCSLLDHEQGAHQFRPLYRHFSSNEEVFERNCIERWFVLSDWMKIEGVERCFVVDSDVLIFVDVKAVGENYPDIDLTHTTEGSQIYGYVNSLPHLEAFGNFLISLYRDDMPLIESEYQRLQATGSSNGISDMCLFAWFQERYPGRYFALNKPVKGIVFDENIKVPRGWEMEGEIKKLRFEGERLFGREVASGEKFQFASAHFQGDTKKLMPSYIRQREFSFWVMHGRMSARRVQQILNKIPQKIFRRFKR